MAEKIVDVVSALSLTSPIVVTAVEHIRPMRGGSQPHLMRCSDGHYYVVKFQNNPQGTRILVNEYITGKLARLLGLPCPDICLVDVREDLVHLTRGLSFEAPSLTVPVPAGLAFGSQYPSRLCGVRRALLSVMDFRPASMARTVENLPDLLGMLVLDKWTSNLDNRQILCVPRRNEVGLRYRMFLIDNGFCFCGKDWDFRDHPLRGVHLDTTVYSQISTPKSLDTWMGRLESIVTWDALTAIAKSLPSVWVDDPGRLLRLLESLYDRKKQVSALVGQALIAMKGTTPVEDVGMAAFARFIAPPQPCRPD